MRLAPTIATVTLLVLGSGCSSEVAKDDERAPASISQFVDAPADGATHYLSIGTVKYFSEARGYGFIVPDDGGEDVHVDVTNVDGNQSLRAGQRVTFTVSLSSRGVKTATDVILAN
ncbi:cold shock domain-containing protein [Nocardioides sp.]|uniref:cold-shock protein n=1 Tax=Nocardioides sp. TaxID=35761 RepID=UPI002CB3B1F8|nr:cold shock domain-containing protein [Nocardioides sp.]HXH80062.1 cold shock domain-containing protein [Nocardioides sp.]